MLRCLEIGYIRRRLVIQLPASFPEGELDIGNHVPSSISIAKDLQKRERNFLLDDYDYMTGGGGGFVTQLFF